MGRKIDIDYSRCHDLTVEEIRACSCFEHLTESEAKDVIETLKLFAKIAYDCHKKDGKKV
jgi:uncharacterized protein YfbU (UPF0304 family)